VQGPDRLVPGWWVHLDGHRFDLEELEEHVTSEGLRVVRHGDGFYLRAAEFEEFAADESSNVDRRAKEIVRIINAAAKVRVGDFGSVSVGPTALVGEDGSIQHTVHASASISMHPRMRVKGSVPGQPERPGPSEIERIAHRGLEDAEVRQALRIFGRDDVDYRDLYFVFEIVRAAARSRMHEEGWATPKEVERFRHTANSRTALGEGARHGHERTEPPKDPMPFEEAKELIRRLLSSWLS
jgi:hypothetical protein